MESVGDVEAEAVTLSWLPSPAYEEAACVCALVCVCV